MSFQSSMSTSHGNDFCFFHQQVFGPIQATAEKFKRSEFLWRRKSHIEIQNTKKKIMLIKYIHSNYLAHFLVLLGKKVEVSTVNNPI